MIRFLKDHNWILVVFFLLILLPQSLTSQSRLSSRIVIAGFAVDKCEDGYELTAQMVFPVAGSESGGSKAKLGFVSQKGKTINECIDKVATVIGKEPGLGHLNFIILGKSLVEDNVFGVMDYIISHNNIDTSVMMLACEGSAKEMIRKTAELELGVAVAMRKNFMQKMRKSSGIVTVAQTFVSDYFEKSKMGMLSYVDIVVDEDGGNQNENANSIVQGQNGKVVYYNKMALFHDGKYRGDLDSQMEILGMNILNKKSKEANVSLDKVVGDVYHDTSVGMELKGKKVKSKYFFENGKPVCEHKISFEKNNVRDLLQYPVLEQFESQNVITEKVVVDKVNEMLSSAINATFEKGKSLGVDVLQIMDNMYRRNPKKFKEYMSDKTMQDFLNDVELRINVKVKSKQ